MQPQAALADGDPASDYFPTVDIFVPLDRPAATNLQKDLDNLVFAAKRRGYVVKVAVIGSRTDLGSVSQLFGKPGTYAKFLGAEIRTFYTGRLLIVMPQGIGGRNVPAGELRALRKSRSPLGARTSSCAPAWRRCGRARQRRVNLPVIPPTPAGVTTAPPAPTVHSDPAATAAPSSSSSSSSSATVILVAAGAACLVLTAAGAVFARTKQNGGAPDPG